MGEISSLQDLLDRENIRDRLYQYCKGVDRIDAELIRGVYWPDVDANQLDFRGGAEAFMKWCFAGVATMDIIVHQIGNVFIDLNGDQANVESTFISYRRVDENGQMQGYIGGGRYLDRFERRDGRWQVAKRLIVIDWGQKMGPSEAVPPAGAAKRWPDDVSYSWFNS